MRFLATTLFVATAFVAAPAHAETVNVVTDIPPVQALVTQIMAGVGTSDQLLPANTSPHSFALRPSQARSLQNADLVVWIGPELMPSLSESIETLAPQAHHLSLLHVAGTVEHTFRPLVQFGDVEDHDKHDDHGGGEDHDAHSEHGDHADHSHEGLDPHAWLDPRNAQLWATAISVELGEIDPDNAGLYAANARKMAAEIEVATQTIADKLEPLHASEFVVFHDAYQYFESRFGLAAIGALLDADGRAPSAARMADLRHVLQEKNVTCVFTEPQFNSDLVASIGAGLSLNVQSLDPMGLHVADATYVAIISAMADAFLSCLTPR